MSSPAAHPVALITGAAVRLGAASARVLHANAYNIVIHCNRSLDAATALADEFNQTRQKSAVVIQADLVDTQAVIELAEKSIDVWNRLDVLVNNASAFYPTPLNDINEQQWHDLFASNARAPLFLSHAVANALKASKGCIITLSDLYARRGLARHSIYTMAKAASEAMTKSLARELAPDVRVNGIAPGAILWPPDESMSGESKQEIIDRSSLKKMGEPEDIANAVLFLATQASYITGQILHVDGGR